jgi:hypothetical protein
MRLYLSFARQNLPVPIGAAWGIFPDAASLARITRPSPVQVRTSAGGRN